MSFVALIDTSAMHLMHDVTQCGFMDKLMPFVSMLGTGGFIWITIAVLLLFHKQTRGTGVAMCLAMLFCYLFGNLFLKNFCFLKFGFCFNNKIIKDIKGKIIFTNISK